MGEFGRAWGCCAVACSMSVQREGIVCVRSLPPTRISESRLVMLAVPTCVRSVPCVGWELGCRANVAAEACRVCGS